jgi:bacterioferritin (cytochrome b1)
MLIPIPRSEDLMMTTSPESLVGLLRQELTAVNQQFFHILALREWGDQDTAARIAQVDKIDFPNAMRIINYLVNTEAPFSLGGAEFSPGTDYHSILKSEQAIEQRLLVAIDNTETANVQEAELVQSAKEPRGNYIKWLEERLNVVTVDDSKPLSVGQETAGTVACLISLAEQSMVHAFFHWHSGEIDAADDAWATSGAAMMHLTEFVQLFAKLPGVPFPGVCPSLDIQGNVKKALDADRQLALLGSKEASSASVKCSEESVSELCEKIASYCSELSKWDSDTTHPAESTNPAAFQSFEMTLKRFVH